MDKFKEGRNSLKDYDRDIIDFSKTDQFRGIEMPALEKEIRDGDEIIRLNHINPQDAPNIDLNKAISGRKSIRKYKDKSMTLEEISYLLWASYGIREIKGKSVFRNAPSAGNRHAIDIYISVHDVSGLKEGIYRYHPIENILVHISSPEDLRFKMAKAARNQPMAGNSQLTFIWVAVPYRMEWRYSYASYKVIALDAGHIAQNLYLAAEAIESGVCAIAAYDQDYSDELLGLDGEDEFVIYMASVGKK
ncbi:MAG: SagB/ThcOx family dehydrogenase [Tissierellia bacterium]|nr:SagB/ThcOx family dehydrogenase [Tissierellia bacterium]